ncbi:hypothetical protein ACVW19_006745 [Streptomyces sp. TE5632]
MVMLCYSDLEDDDRVGVPALHSALESWVLRLLVDTQDRATRVPARFASPIEDCTPEDEALALWTIRFLRYAEEQPPAGAPGVLQAPGEVRAGPADLVLHVPLHGALGDTERVGHGAGALELLQVAHLRADGRGEGAGERLLHGCDRALHLA